jgi:hypothetical protein
MVMETPAGCYFDSSTDSERGGSIPRSKRIDLLRELQDGLFGLFN